MAAELWVESRKLARYVGTAYGAGILMQFINIILRTALLTPIMIIISMFMVIRTSMTLSMVIGGCVPLSALGYI